MKWWRLLAAAVSAIILGMLLGWMVDVTPTQQAPQTDFKISEVLLGIPATPPTADRPWRGTDRLAQKREYTITDLLALRVVSSEPPERQMMLSIRLLNEAGYIQSLSPGSIQIMGGTDGYCCWQVATPGTYSLQIFRSDQAPLVLPLTIIKSQQSKKSPIQL